MLKVQIQGTSEIKIELFLTRASGRKLHRDFTQISEVLQHS